MSLKENTDKFSYLQMKTSALFIQRYHKEVRENKFQGREIFAVHDMYQISYKLKNPMEKIHKEIFQNIRGYINVKPKCIEIIKVSKCLLQLMVTKYLRNYKNANKTHPEIYLTSYNLTVIKKAHGIYHTLMRMENNGNSFTLLHCL